MMSPSWGFFIISILSTILLKNSVGGVAVMSVDLGSEWMKVAIVSVSKILNNVKTMETML